MHTVFLAAFALLFSAVLAETETSQSQNGTSEVTADNSQTPTVRPIDEGMQPFFTMTKIFLDVVRPESDVWLLYKIEPNQLSGKNTCPHCL